MKWLEQRSRNIKAPGLNPPGGRAFSLLLSPAECLKSGPSRELHLFLMGLSQPHFLYFCLFYFIQLTDKFLPMLGFEPHISGVGGDCSPNCATTATKRCIFAVFPIKNNLSCAAEANQAYVNNHRMTIFLNS